MIECIGNVVGKWIDFEGKGSEWFYALGPLDDKHRKPFEEAPEEKKQFAEEEYNAIYFGRVSPL